MDEKWKNRITEAFISNLLQRYSDTTVLQLLKEVEESAAEKIDWNAIVKKTTTGISTAREYQMVWRHIAYGGALPDQFDVSNPLDDDDDSDLEDEMEAYPAVSRESSAEASACVKVLVASNSHVPNKKTVEAPLTINVPMLKMPSDSSPPEEKNIVIPVSVLKERLYSRTSGEKRPSGKSRADVPPRRKRKAWSTEDDSKLTAAVQKYGEENWAIIAGGDLKNDRTPEELSQRWASIKKKKSNSNTGASAGLSLFEAVRAAIRAINLALGPKANNMKAAHQMSNIGSNTTQHESQIASAPPSNPPQLGTAGPPKSQVLNERPPISCTTSPTSTIKDNALAAGDRISNPSCSQNVAHITTGTSSSTATMANQLSSNLSCNSPTKAEAFPSTVPILQHSVTKGPNSIDPRELAVQPNPLGTTFALDMSSGKVNATASISSDDTKYVGVSGLSISASAMQDIVQRAQAAGFSPVCPKAAADLDSALQLALIRNQSKPEVGTHTSASGNATTFALDMSSGKVNATASISSDDTKYVGVSGLSISASAMQDIVQRAQAAGFNPVCPKAAADLDSALQLALIRNQSKPEVGTRTSASGNTPGGNIRGDEASVSFSLPVNQAQDLHVALPCPNAEDDDGEKHGDNITTGKEIHDNTNNSNTQR